MEYTKGEWEARLRPSYTQNYVYASSEQSDDGRVVALNIPNQQDAHLIAAAPDMYEALKVVVDSYERLGTSACMARVIKEIPGFKETLAKADGGD